jgi:hypothetical protein
MADQEKRAVIQALEEVRRNFQAENYADKNLRDRMRGAHLLGMRLLGVQWPSKGDPIPQDWWKRLRTL